MHISDGSTKVEVRTPGTTPEAGGSRPGSRSHRRSEGQALVELALIVMILTVMMVGTLELGRAFSAWLQVGNMARAGAQYGSIAAMLGDKDLAEVGSAALEDQNTIYGVSPDVDWQVINDDYGFCAVEVTVDYRLSTLIPVSPIPSEIDLSRSTVMRLQFVSAEMEMPDEENPCR